MKRIVSLTLIAVALALGIASESEAGFRLFERLRARRGGGCASSATVSAPSAGNGGGVFSCSGGACRVR